MHTYEDKCLWKMHAPAVTLKVERERERERERAEGAKREFIRVRVSERELNSELVKC